MKPLRILLPNILFLLAIASPAIGQVNYQKIISIDGQQLIVSDMCATSDSGVVITCNAGYNSYAVRYSNSGSLVWSKKFASPDFTTRSVSPTSDGGFLISGYITAGPPTANEAALVKINSAGDIMFVKTVGNGWQDTGHDAIQIPGTGYIMCASILATANEPRSGLFRVSPTGIPLWGKTYDDTSAINFYMTRLAAKSQNRVVAAFTSHYPSAGTSDIDGGLMMVDQNGNILWSKSYHYPEWNDFRDVKVTADGGLIVSGFIDLVADGQTVRDFLLMKTDSLGNITWAKAYGRSNDDLGYSVMQASDGGYIMAGSLYSNSSISSCAIVKTDATGNIIWTNQFFTLSTFPEGNVVVPSGNTGYHVLTTRQQSLLFDAMLIRVGTNGMGYCNDSTASFSPVSVTFQTTSPVKYIATQSIQAQTFTTSQPVVTEFVPCIPSALEESGTYPAIALSPNPSFDGDFTITHHQSPKLVTCYDVTGRAINAEITKIGSEQTKIHIATNGFYFIKIQTDNTSSTFSVLVTKE